MKIFITGANGFIGSSLVNYLQAHTITRIPDYQLYCLVRKTSNIERLKPISDKINFVYGDVRDKSSLIDAVKNVDFIIHSAAVLRCIKNKTYYEVNQMGTKNLIETVVDHNPNLKAFIYISSQAAAGPCKNQNFKNRNDFCEPVSHYGKSKFFAEQEVLKYSDKIKIIILRPAAVYGPWDKDMFLYFQYAKSGFLPMFSKKFFIQFVFINDLVEICSKIIHSIDKIPSGKYFVAEEKCYNLDELKKVFSDTVGKKVNIISFPYWFGYIYAYLTEMFYKIFLKKPAVFNRDKLNELKHPYWLCNSSELKNILNFNYTPLPDGVKLTYSWYKENHWL